MSHYRPNPRRYYSNSWTYPGHYDGYHCAIPTLEDGYCIPEPGENASCESSYYDYIHSCKGYPFDLTELDKVIDLMANPTNTFYDLNG